MGAWGQQAGSEDVNMLADGNGEFAKAIGLELDGSGSVWANVRSDMPWLWMTARLKSFSLKLRENLKLAQRSICYLKYKRF